MDEQKRNEINEATALRGDAPYMLGNLAVRRLSVESLGVLERIGSPLAAQFVAGINRAEAAAVSPGTNDILKFIWAHAEAPDTVLGLALQCSPAYTAPVDEAALLFARHHLTSPEQLGEAVRYIMATDEELKAASFQAHAPEVSGGKAIRAKKKA